MKYAIALLIAFWLSGCSTLSTKFGEDPQWGSPYSGTKASPGNSRYYMGKATDQGPMVVLVFWGSIIDFLSSFGADTVVLPADLVIAVSNFMGSSEEEATEEGEEAEEEQTEKPGQMKERPKRWL